MVTLRAATQEDSGAIRSLIYTVRINPFGLSWRRFLLAVDNQDQLIGCGQIKPHGDGSRELASIAVRPSYQGQGIGKLLIEQLIKSAPLPIYLTCRSELQPFYTQFGFAPLARDQMPPYFQRLWGTTQFFSRFFPAFGSLRVMRLG
jgi:N-acetylglutamate synthase-like GNAT family acetyltransferase